MWYSIFPPVINRRPLLILKSSRNVTAIHSSKPRIQPVFTHADGVLQESLLCQSLLVPVLKTTIIMPLLFLLPLIPKLRRTRLPILLVRRSLRPRILQKARARLGILPLVVWMVERDRAFCRGSRQSFSVVLWCFGSLHGFELMGSIDES